MKVIINPKSLNEELPRDSCKIRIVQEFGLNKVIKWKAAKSNLGQFMTHTIYF